MAHSVLTSGCSIGTVLCLPTEPVPMVTKFVAQVIIFDIELPITVGASVKSAYLLPVFSLISCQVELFHHSRTVPATLSRLIATLDRATSVVLKHNPRLEFLPMTPTKCDFTFSTTRVLAKLASAKVEVTLRGTTINGPSAHVSAIPLETFKANKEMGRLLLRRGGETIAAGLCSIYTLHLLLRFDTCGAGIVVELL